ncbi:MAG: CocE/NonD family hydrolase, partial [Psychrosphaera sp.]|nr:CocE/NonD family hydrolase [Psychrosphaera sp.]
QLPFFKFHLKDKKAPNLARVTVFETGANRWRRFDKWPPKSTHKHQWLLANNEKLLTTKKHSPKGFSEYISDPNKPVPYSKAIDLGWSSDFMVEDQRFAARRSDVLVFNTDILIADNTIAGAVELDLWVSTSQTSADFVVKLVDVFPNLDLNNNKTDRKTGNRHELVRWGVLRGRYRESLSQPKPFTPNKPTKITVKLDDILHTFKTGHRVQIQIQSSFFPFIDRNPQKYVDNIFKAKAADFVKATHKVYHNKDLPSSMRFNTID